MAPLLKFGQAASEAGPPPPEGAIGAFTEFYEAVELAEAREAFDRLLGILGFGPGPFEEFFPRLKQALKPHLPFKYKEIWKILETRSKLKVYGGVASNQSVMVVGAGPCGLRTAIEMQLLGVNRTVVLERRAEFTRNNILKLWKFLIEDLKMLGAKKLFGKFCSGNINHVGIKALQLILAKVCLMVGAEIHAPVSFVDLSEPTDAKKWTAVLEPADHPLASFEFSCLVVASGKKVAIEGFDRRSLDAKLSIAITANFVNRGTSEEAAVRQISGISKQFHPEFFAKMQAERGISLENIVYYRGDTHYFVMTALRRSLIDRGVIRRDHEDRRDLLAPSNVDRQKLHEYAVDAAHFATAYYSTQLPTEEFALDGSGRPDCAVFDFTNLYSARNASKVRVRLGHQLLMAIVGDSLLEPFWPEGTGCARGFLSSMDAAWMVRQWALGKRNPLDILCERENIYRLLSQTSDGQCANLKDGYKGYSIDPSSRYRNKPKKIDHDRIIPLYDSDDADEKKYLEEIFVKQKYYTPEIHRNLLQRLGKGVIKKGQTGLMLPVRVARAFRRTQPAPAAAPGPAAAAN